MLGTVKLCLGIWEILMVSELVTGASISQISYDDYVVGEQSLEWRGDCEKFKACCFVIII